MKGILEGLGLHYAGHGELWEFDDTLPESDESSDEEAADTSRA
jgi:hypothetical protein